MYLESALPALGDVYCIQPSFRAERSHTPRHLSEYTHCEAEFGFLAFDDLLNRIESLFEHVVTSIQKDEESSKILKEMNPDFEWKGIERLRYSNAIRILNEIKVEKKGENKSEWMYGEDIPDYAEKLLVQHIGRPIFLTHFPRSLKSFYMKPCPDNKEETESVDLLLPGIGEVLGGSMRLASLELLQERMSAEGLDASKYKWYLDTRRYGTCEHGGFGIGIERLVAWFLRRKSVGECTLYPRFEGRCTP